MIKAIAGGGGRGMRVVRDARRRRRRLRRAADRRPEPRSATATCTSSSSSTQSATSRCRSLGDGEATSSTSASATAASSAGTRSSSRSRPAPASTPQCATSSPRRALRMAREAGLQNAATFEFLVETADVDTRVHRGQRRGCRSSTRSPRRSPASTSCSHSCGSRRASRSPISGSAATLRSTGSRSTGSRCRLASTSRRSRADGTVRPSGGVLRLRARRRDRECAPTRSATTGYQTNPAFDSLLAKVIGHAASEDVSDAIDRTRRALRELRMIGVETNTGFLEAVLAHPDVRAGVATTDFVDRTRRRSRGTGESGRVGHALGCEPSRCGRRLERPARGARARQVVHGASRHDTVTRRRRQCGRRSDPRHRRQREHQRRRRGAPGQPLLVMEAMKMEHVIESTMSGIVRAVTVSVGDTVFEGHPLVVVEADGEVRDAIVEIEAIDLDAIRPDLAEALDRQAMTRDEARPEAVARRRRDEPAHRARERRRLVRPGVVPGVRLPRDRRATAPAHAGRPHRPHTGGRHDLGHRPRQRSAVPGLRSPLHRDVVRLHGARRDAGPAEPPEEGPAVRARRALAAARRRVHRGRWRPPR